VQIAMADKALPLKNITRIGVRSWPCKASFVPHIRNNIKMTLFCNAAFEAQKAQEILPFRAAT